MKKIIFKVNTKKESSLTSLLKDLNRISCRINIDLENNLVTVENVNDAMIDSVVDLIDNHYTVLSINIDNASTETDDDLIIKKVHFENKCVEEAVNKLLKTSYWAMSNANASETKIHSYITTTMSEISMRFSPKDSISFNVGDVVDCSYGTHLWGEITGNHVPSIVCNISNGKMAYVVPITGSNYSSPFTLCFNMPEDVVYKDNTETRSTALLDKGRYVCTKRFNSVIGKTSPSFLEKLLRLIPLTFDFTDCLSSNSISTEKDACNVSVSENPSDTVESAVTVVPEVTITSEDNTITSEVEQKLGKEESAMLEVIGFALDKLDSSKPFKEQLDSFLADIDLEATELIKQVFFIACNVEKITYGYIINELEHDFCFSKGKNNSTKIVKETFKCWLEKHPDLARQYPKISIMPMLKLFAKKIRVNFYIK